MDRTGTRATDQEEQGTIAYVQNAEQQSSSAIWKKLKGL